MIGDAGEGEEGFGGAVAGGGVGVFDLFFGSVEGVVEEGAEAGGGLGEEGRLTLLESSADGFVVGPPAVEGFSVDGEGGGNGGVGVSQKHQFEGRELAR